MAKTFEQDILITQKITGLWIVPEFDPQKEFWGTLEYDPEHGVGNLTLFGYPVLTNMSITKYNSALGKATNGKIITFFDLKLCD